jgi:hypothetical protein
MAADNSNHFVSRLDGGIFTLKTVQQLFVKLLRDYDGVKAAPADSERWFNFIVTADHMPEWESAADEDRAKRLRTDHALLRVCHDLSINAKHFQARKPKAVARTHEAYVYRFNADIPSEQPMPQRLEFYVELGASEVTEMGVEELSALELAGRLVKFWRDRLGIAK